MAIPSARLLVASPSRAPLPFGLMSVAQMPTDVDSHWRLGVRIEPDTCERAGINLESCPATGVGDTKDPTGNWFTRASDPFTVYTMPVCAPVGNYDVYEQRVRGALTSGEARAVEREFWTGEFGVTPHLAEDTAVTGTGFDSAVIEQTAATIITGGPVDIVEGIALLEQSLGDCYGNEGVLHVPQIALSHMRSKTLVERDGVRLRSPAGHLVAAGAGYTGSSPAGVAPSDGVYWLYATGAVFVRRDGVNITSTLAQAVDRAKNDMYLVAERTYVIGWDCCHFAIPVRLGGDVTGAVGAAT